MLNAERQSVAFLQAACYSALDTLSPLEKMVAKKIADETFLLLLSLIDRIEKLEGKTP